MLSNLILNGACNFVLWGIGAVGVVLQILLSLFLNSQVKASNNMVTTRKKAFCTMRQKYENNRSLGLVVTDHDAFVEKYFLRIRFLGIPLYNMQNAMKTLGTVAFLVAWGGIGYSVFNDLPSYCIKEMAFYGVAVIAFLLLVENIIPIKNKIGIMKANVRDYLLNSSISRRREKVKQDIKSEVREDVGNGLEAAATKGAENIDLPVAKKNKEPAEPQKISDDDVLASFLRNYLREE